MELRYRKALMDSIDILIGGLLVMMILDGLALNPMWSLTFAGIAYIVIPPMLRGRKERGDAFYDVRAGIQIVRGLLFLYLALLAGSVLGPSFLGTYFMVIAFLHLPLVYGITRKS